MQVTLKPTAPLEPSSLDKNSDLEQAARVQRMVQLYNQKKEISQHSRWCRDSSEKEELREKYKKIQAEYKIYEKEINGALYSLSSLISQKVYDKAPIISEEEFCKQLWHDPNKSPLGNIYRQTVEELKPLFPSKRPLVRIDNGDGHEFVLLSLHDEVSETVIALYKPLKIRRLKSLVIESDGKSSGVIENSMSFSGALCIMQLIHIGKVYEMFRKGMTTYRGFNETPLSDEGDRGSG